MAENLIIKIDGDASGLEKELSNASGTGIRAFRKFGDEAEGQLHRMQQEAEDLGEELDDAAVTGERGMQKYGRTGQDELARIRSQARTTGKAAGDSMVDAANRSQGAWSKVVTMFKSIAATYAVREIIKIGKESIKLASDLTEVQNVVDVTFGEGNEKIEKFSQTAARQFGISELSAKQMAGTMGAMLKSLDVQNVDDMSISLVGLAADMGSFYNMDAEEAFAKLRSGISGETEPLKQLGINMSVANLEAFALSQGMKKQYKDMTAAEQATLRYNYIMKATADAQGDFARTSGSMANQLKITKLNLENIKASIGKALLPAATAATTAFNNFVTNVTAAAPQIKNGISGMVENIRSSLDSLGIGSRLQWLLQTVKSTLNQVIGFVVNIVQAFAKSPALEGAKNAFTKMFNGILGVWDSLRGLLETLWIYLEPVWEGLKAGIQGFVDAWISAKTMIMDVLSGVYGLISGVIELIIGILTLDKDRIIAAVTNIKTSVINIAKALWEGLKAVLTNIWNGISNFLTTMIQRIKAKVSQINLKENGKQLLESLKTGIKNGWESIKAWFSTTKTNALNQIGAIDLRQKAIDILSTLIAGFITKWVDIVLWLDGAKNAIINWIARIDLKQKAIDVLQKLKDGFITKWAEIQTWLDEKKQAIIDTLAGIDLLETGKNIVNSLKNGFVSAWDSFVGTIEDLINAVIDKLPDSLFSLLGLTRERISLRGSAAPAETGAAPEGHRGKTKVIGTFPSGTMDYMNRIAEYYSGMPQTRFDLVATAAEELSDAADSLEDAAESQSQTSTDTVGPNQDKGLANIEGPVMSMYVGMEALGATAERTEADLQGIADTAEAAEDVVAEIGEEVETAAGSIEDIVDDGIELTFDDSAMTDLGEMIADSEPDEEPDYLEMFSDMWANLFSDHTETLDGDLNGIDSHMQQGFADVTGSGESGGSGYSLLDEYNELMGLWSTNKDANGEWAADWSEGGIGETLANLIQGKMPGKYWGDLSPEDLARMGNMTASEGYVQGQYQTQFRPAEPVEIPAKLDIVEVEGSEEDGTMDFAALSEAIPEESILSWQNLSAAIQSVMDALSGGEEGTGLLATMQGISSIIGESLPGQIDTFASYLTGTLPTAVDTAMEFLGRVGYDEEGNVLAGGGNTLYTSLGSIFTLFEDTNVQIENFCQGLSEMVPKAVETFKIPAGEAIGLVESLWIAALGAADAINDLAGAISALAGAMEDLNENGGFPQLGGGGGGGISGHAHGGQINGVGIIGENGPEIYSTSRNMNIFTNRALEIAQAKVANAMSRQAYSGESRNPGAGAADLMSIRSGDNISVTVEGSIFGESWLQDYVIDTMTAGIRKQLMLAR